MKEPVCDDTLIDYNVYNAILDERLQRLDDKARHGHPIHKQEAGGAASGPIQSLLHRMSEVLGQDIADCMTRLY